MKFDPAINNSSDPALAIESRVRAVLRTIKGVEQLEDRLLDPQIRRSQRCDFQINGLLGIARRVGLDPEALANAVIQAVDFGSTVERYSISGPGFINVWLNDAYLSAQLSSMAEDPRLGLGETTERARIVVDYSHPNVAKEMHVGHLRTTILGDSIVRVLELFGHEVIRENHIGDWGTPFGMLIEHMVDVGASTGAAELSVGELNSFYRAAREKFDSSFDFAERARKRVVALQAGDAESLKLWTILVTSSVSYFELVYRKLGIRLTPDDVVGESFYNEMLPLIVDELARKGLIKESNGALCCFPPGFLGRDGEPQPLIVRKADGGYGYAATDLAALKDRAQRIRAGLIVYVVGAPQKDHLAMCFAVANQAGWLGECEAVHVPFGSVLGADNKVLKSRSGDSIRLVDLLDEAISRATVLVQEKSSDLDPSERTTVAHAVGIGALKYAELSVDRTKDYTFDFERMLAFEGNTGPYLQYAYARLQSILRKARAAHFSPSDHFRVEHPAERELALSLLGFSSALTESARRFAPHVLCSHLFTVATLFASFYEHCPVLKADPETRAARLALCDLVARVIAQGLSVLGIAAPNRL